jgi:putative transposase
MSQYRRLYIPGGVYFFTVVTFARKPIFADRAACELLHRIWIKTRRRPPSITEAFCLLPDHLHCIWRLPEGDSDFSIRWSEIKRLFTKGYVETIGYGGYRNASRRKKREAAVWQRRIWELALRDQEDVSRHMAYIHFNPVKHGLVHCTEDWPWSSFHRFTGLGLIEPDWSGEESRVS